MLLHELMRQARKQRGLTQEALAQRLGVTRTAVNMWESGKNVPSRDNLASIIGILGLDPGLALGLDASGPATQPETPVSIAVGAWPATIPVFAAALVSGGHPDEFEIDTTTVHRVARPPRLARRNDVFALHVQGTTMSPWREPGQLVVIDNVKPPRPSEYVIARLNDTTSAKPRCLLARLKSIDTEQVVLEQFTPNATITIARHDVFSLQRVIEADEMLEG